MNKRRRARDERGRERWDENERQMDGERNVDRNETGLEVCV